MSEPPMPPNPDPRDENENSTADPVTPPEATEGEPTTTAGYMVMVYNDTTRCVEADWNGEVYKTFPEANQEAVRAKSHGWDAFPVALVARRFFTRKELHRD